MYESLKSKIPPAPSLISLCRRAAVDSQDRNFSINSGISVARRHGWPSAEEESCVFGRRHHVTSRPYPVLTSTGDAATAAAARFVTAIMKEVRRGRRRFDRSCWKDVSNRVCVDRDIENDI